MTEGPYLYRMSGTTTWRVVEVMLIGGEPIFFLPGVSYSHRPQVGDDFVRLVPERPLDDYDPRGGVAEVRGEIRLKGCQ